MNKIGHQDPLRKTMILKMEKPRRSVGQALVQTMLKAEIQL